MSKKPSLSISKEKRLKEAKKELEAESINTREVKTKQTTVILEEGLLYSAKEIALKRKRLGVEPSTITGMIRQALMDIVHKEINT